MEEMFATIERQYDLILKNIGIRICLSECPAYKNYFELRDRLDRMNPIHRFFSWGLQQKCGVAKKEAMQEFLNAVLEEGSSHIESKVE